ncbi:MAG: hypothetical protein GDA51_04190 [Ekhidna sp.]|nr:hypothetical protein [Ekhidna sp.]MBC6425667.1 hypothetical protein [Ekhidna sp.]
MKKGFARLIFLVVFLIPVVWYLFLQLFGNNSFSLELKEEIDTSCGTFDDVTVIVKTDSVSLSKQNYLERVKFGINKRSVRLVINNIIFFQCIDEPETDLILLDEQGLWGSYSLSRDGVDLLLTEVDILLLQKSHGKGTSR